MSKYDDYPYAGFYPGDPPPGSRILKIVGAVVALALLVFVLTACGETPKPATQAPERPGCVSVPMVEAKMNEEGSDFAGEDHAHLKDDKAEALTAKVLGQPLPVSDVLVYPMPDGMRVLFFNQGCLVHFKDVVAPRNTKSQSL